MLDFLSEPILPGGLICLVHGGLAEALILLTYVAFWSALQWRKCPALSVLDAQHNLTSPRALVIRHGRCLQNDRRKVVETE